MRTLRGIPKRNFVISIVLSTSSIWLRNYSSEHIFTTRCAAVRAASHVFAVHLGSHEDLVGLGGAQLLLNDGPRQHLALAAVPEGRGMLIQLQCVQCAVCGA